MDDHQTLIDEIEQYCRARTIAESTFGRMAVNDGKFVGRLRSGKGVTTRTLKRVQEFMAAEGATAESADPPAVLETLSAGVNEIGRAHV